MNKIKVMVNERQYKNFYVVDEIPVKTDDPVYIESDGMYRFIESIKEIFPDIETRNVNVLNHRYYECKIIEWYSDDPEEKMISYQYLSIEKPEEEKVF